MNQTEINERTDLLCKMLQFQEGIYENTLVELDDDLALKRPNDRTNHINWLLGHLLHCRVMLMNMIGKKTAYPFEGIYWSPIEDGKYRTIGEISDSFSQISKELISNLENLGIENLDRKKEPEQPTLQ
ncbi:MAG: hypothetical protein HKN76_08470, partial [Saprospiraceae bacterium]|nr:hypothetical protein [Saprospiraceae bacterium]